MRGPLAVAATLALAGPAQAAPFSAIVIGTAGTGMGIVCLVGEVRVLTATAEDCGRIGGKATHPVRSRMKPMER